MTDESGMEALAAAQAAQAQAKAAASSTVVDLDVLHIGNVMNDAMRRLMARAEGKEKPIPLPWEELSDALGGGLWPQTLGVLVANTATGKTQLGLQIAEHAAAHGTPTLYIGLELGPLDTSARLLALRAQEKWSKLYLGRMAPAQLNALVEEHGPSLANAPLYLAFAPPHGFKAADLQPLLAALRARFPEAKDEQGDRIPGSRPLLLVLDFLQILTGDESELRERIGKASYAAKALAKELDAAVLLISSTARDNYEKLEKKPGEGNPAKFVGLGKESGEIEFSADYLLVMMREPWVDDMPPPNGTVTHVGIAKIRARPENSRSWLKLSFDGSRFTELSTNPWAKKSGSSIDNEDPSKPYEPTRPLPDVKFVQGNHPF